MKLNIYVAFICILLFAVRIDATKYAGEIFYLSPGVAHQAMGSTGLTDPGAISVAWWNSALVGISQDQGIEISHHEIFEGLLKQNLISGYLGKENPLAFSINHIGISDIKLTKLENEDEPLSNDNRPVVWDNVTNNDLIVQMGLSRSIRDNIRLGIAPKLAYRSLAKHSGYGFGADVGFYWKTSSFNAIGINLRDAFTTQLFWDNGTHEFASPLVDLETQFKFSIIKKSMPVCIALRSQLYTDGREETATANFSWIGADFNAGISLQPIRQLTLYSGYDVDKLTAGATVHIKRFDIDYAWVQGSEDNLGYSQKAAISFRW